MRKKWKKLVAGLVATVLVWNMGIGGYETVQAAAIAAPSALGVLESIFGSFGFFAFSAEMIKTLTKEPDTITDEEWNEIQLAFWQDQLEAGYEEERQKKMKNPSPSVTPEPSPDPSPGVTPVPAPIPEIPTFSELINLGATAGFIDWTQDVWECMGEAVSKLWDKLILDNHSSPFYDSSYFQYPSEDIILNFPYYCGTTYMSIYGNTQMEYQYSTYYSNIPVSYYVRTDLNNSINYYDYSADGSFIHFYIINRTIITDLSNKVISDVVNIQDDASNSSGYLTGLYLRSTKSFMLDNFKSSIYSGSYAPENLLSKAKENIWVHPDLQETYQNNGKLEYPQQAPQPLNIPTIEQLRELAKKLNPEFNPSYTPEMAPNYIQELINALKRDPSVDPNPDPDPDPDPGTDPNPDPKPSTTPELSPTPDPEEEIKGYSVDLTKVFPFCIPFDLIDLIDALDAEPVAPVFEFPIDLTLQNPWTGAKVIDYHKTFVLDFADFEEVVKLLRVMQVLLFLIGLMLITRSHMIKG